MCEYVLKGAKSIQNYVFFLFSSVLINTVFNNPNFFKYLLQKKTSLFLTS